MIVKIEGDAITLWTFFDNVQDFQCQESVNRDKEVIMEIKFQQGSRRMEFTTKNRVYLLNDEGKTIEKIN